MLYGNHGGITSCRSYCVCGSPVATILTGPGNQLIAAHQVSRANWDEPINGFLGSSAAAEQWSWRPSTSGSWLSGCLAAWLGYVGLAECPIQLTFTVLLVQRACITILCRLLAWSASSLGAYLGAEVSSTFEAGHLLLHAHILLWYVSCVIK